MLSLIPYEICKNIPSIKEYLGQQQRSVVTSNDKD